MMLNANSHISKQMNLFSALVHLIQSLLFYNIA